MTDIDQFLSQYVPASMTENAKQKLQELIDKYSGSSVIMSPSEVSAFDGDGCALLMIGEGGEHGFYAVTGNMRTAITTARHYMRDDCGMDSDYIKDIIETAKKTSLHIYTKPWEEGEYSEWYWYAQDSTHEKAETVVKFEIG